jgi:hypothetical protein
VTLALPTDDQIRARAEELKLIEPGAALPHDLRRRVAKTLLEEAQQPPTPPAAYEPVLLSRVTQPAAGGMLRVDVLFIPNPPPPQEGPTS